MNPSLGVLGISSWARHSGEHQLNHASKQGTMNTQFADEARRQEGIYSRSHRELLAKPVEFQICCPSIMLATLTCHPKTQRASVFVSLGGPALGDLRTALSLWGWMNLLDESPTFMVAGTGSEIGRASHYGSCDFCWNCWEKMPSFC